MVENIESEIQISIQAIGIDLLIIQSIEEDYDNYKEQISEDTINENEEEINILLRKGQTQDLFESYYFEKGNNFSSKKTSFSTNHTEDNVSRK